MNNIIFIFLIFSYSILAMVPSCRAAVNIAKGKPYTVSPRQNYQLSAAPTNTTAITDGVYTVGYFWTRPSTVGWHNTKTVEILIDLEKEATIASIVFSTARGVGVGVHYPKHIAAFVGSDLEHLQYINDLADIPDNKPGSYQLKRFVQKDIGARGRYVLLIVVTKGFYLFCDEIEVLEGDIAKEQVRELNLQQAREFTDQIRRMGIEKELLNRLTDDLQKTRVDPEMNARLQGMKRQIASLKSVKESVTMETELLALRGVNLRALFPDNLLQVRTVNPWAPINPVSTLAGSSPSLTFTLPLGGYESSAFTITNISAKPCEVYLSLDSVTTGVSFVLYHVPFVKSAAIEYVADPLVPVSGTINLRPGESRMIFLTALGKQPGKWNFNLRIKNNGKVTSLSITTRVVNVEMPNNSSINAVNWGYLDFSLIRNRQQAAVDDLLAHHTNVVVVPPVYLPVPELLNDTYFIRLEKYLKHYKGTSKVLLYTDFSQVKRSTVNGKYPFMGLEWQGWFRKWYKMVAMASSRAGFSQDQLYMYPYDEMAGKNIDDFVAFSSWVRQEIPSIKLYATINDKAAEKALPYMDVAQVSNNDELLGKFRSSKAELWIYDTKYPAKSLSPYAYYRLMPWKAFLRGYKGVGFWAYADAGWGDNPGTAWDDFDNEGWPDFAVIYEGEGNSIVSSRRWEAWRMGIEDYELLTMYAKVRGESAAKALAKTVLDHPEDTAKADEVRRNILIELSKTN